MLVGVGRGIEEADLDELAALADSAGAEPVERVLQTRQDPNPATFVGKGKINEVHDAVHRSGAEAVILDDELTPGQLRSLEERLKVKVIDRTALILDIFALHARSREGKAQVELAQLTYLLPRLRGWGEAMSRLGGGIGTRGPGETKLEVDRQHIKRRISKLRKDLKDLARTRDVKRSSRERSGIPQVAITGYTNAGKSTLMNALTRSDVVVANQLFATLDPTVRKIDLPSGRAATISDTVGFVSKLPHELVEAFRSTLEEVARVDADRPRRRRGLARRDRTDRRRARGPRRDRRRAHPRGAGAQQDRPALRDRTRAGARTHRRRRRAHQRADRRGSRRADGARRALAPALPDGRHDPGPVGARGRDRDAPPQRRGALRGRPRGRDARPRAGGGARVRDGGALPRRTAVAPDRAAG